MKSLLILVVSLAALVSGNICPPEEVMAPCKCEDYDFGKFINCQTYEPFNLKEILHRAAQYIDHNVEFESLGIYSTTLKEIEEGTNDFLKFRRIHVQSNYDLGYIHPQAFRGSQNYTEHIHMEGSHGSMTRINESIFDVINGFKKLNFLRIQTFNITTVPTNALHDLPDLATVHLTSNWIGSVKTKAFSNLPNLTMLSLSFNNIDAGGFAPEAFQNVGDHAAIDVTFNDLIDHLEESSFSSMFDNTSLVKIGGCYDVLPWPWPCVDKKFECDERADWICNDLDRFQGKVAGYFCENSAHYDVWGYCRAKNGTSHNM